MSKNLVRIGTRGSKLALFQAEQVKGILDSNFKGLRTEIIVIATKGDKILDTALSKIGDKSLFTKEIENALLKKEIDLAVHSLKDLTTMLPHGLKLGAVLKRGEFRDAFVHKRNKKLSEITERDTIATSSLRRRSALLHLNNKLNIIDIRGNVNTRLKKMNEGHCDGMIMAAAGLIRLGLESYISEIIEPEYIIPAVSQGAIAIESRKGDDFTDKIVSELNHQKTMYSVLSERSFMNTLQGGCQIPVGCYSTIEGDNLTLCGFIASTDGIRYIKDSIEGLLKDGINLGNQLALKLLNAGGSEILNEIRTST